MHVPCANYFSFLWHILYFVDHNAQSLFPVEDTLWPSPIAFGLMRNKIFFPSICLLKSWYFLWSGTHSDYIKCVTVSIQDTPVACAVLRSAEGRLCGV